MYFNLKSPCKNCPFRKDVEPYISEARCKDIVFALTKDNKTFACHKTVDYNDIDEESREVKKNINESHCAGALIVMERNNIAQNNNMIRIAERLKIYDYKILNLKAPVYKNFKIMIKAHKGL